MPPDRIGARLLDVGRKHAGSVLKLEFRARGFDPEHAGTRDDRDDRQRDDHLRDGEPALLRLCFAVGFHLRDYLRQANPWSIFGKRCSYDLAEGNGWFLDLREENEQQAVTFSDRLGKRTSYR